MGSKAQDPGDLQAYVKLMTEHQGNLRAFIVSLMPGSPDVPDVLQEPNPPPTILAAFCRHSAVNSRRTTKTMLPRG